MKKLLVLSIIMISSLVNAQNYSFFENNIRLINSEDKKELGTEIATLTHFGFFPITERFGFTDYASIEANNKYQYGQVLLGGYYSITENLSIYLMGGLESVSRQPRFGYMLYYTTGDKIRTYAFYQRNKNPFTSQTKASEWYDIFFRYAIISKDSNSLYLAARYMRGYGLGVPVIFRFKISEGDSVYLGYTAFYDVDKLLPETSTLHSISLTFEFF